MKGKRSFQVNFLRRDNNKMFYHLTAYLSLIFLVVAFVAVSSADKCYAPRCSQPENEGQIFPHPNREKYYRCQYKVLYVDFCPGGMAFHALRRQCVPMAEWENYCETK